MADLTLGWVADRGGRRHHVFMRENVITSVLIALLLPATAAAAPGDLDPTFGAGGRLVSEVDKRNSEGETEFQDVLALRDGRVVAVGTTYRRERLGGHRRDRSRAIVARFRANGRLDRTFSENGFALVNTAEPQDEGVALAAGPKSSVMVGLRSGSGDQYGVMEQTVVARLRRSGRLDRTFAGNGITTPPLPGGRPSMNQIVDLTTDGAGRTIAVGIFQEDYEYGNPQDVSITRLTRRGRLDASFAGDGKLVLSLEGLAENGLGEIGLYEEEPTGVDVDSQNRVVIAGNGVGYEPTRAVHGVLRLTPEGDLDEAFSDDGWHTGSAPEFRMEGISVIDNDELLVGGGESGDFGVMRFNADGTPDMQFGDGGVARAELTGLTPTAFAVAPGGEPVVGGYTGRLGGFTRTDFAVARFLPSGELDSSFGDDGAVRTSLRRADIAQGLAVHPDGRIVQAGRASGRRKNFFALVRYLP